MPTKAITGAVAAGALLVSVLLGVLKAALPALPNSVLVKSAMEIATVKLEVVLTVNVQVRSLLNHVHTHTHTRARARTHTYTHTRLESSQTK